MIKKNKKEDKCPAGVVMAVKAHGDMPALYVKIKDISQLADSITFSDYFTKHSEDCVCLKCNREMINRLKI